MLREGTTQAAEAVIQTLRTRGWSIGDIDQVKALIIIHSALSDDRDNSAVADSVESELLNMDLKSIGAKSLPDSNFLRKTSHLEGPKILQISSVRDISVSSIERFSDSSNRRLLRFILTDGHNEITAIEYSHIPSIPNDVVPGAKIRLENKVPIHSGIVCLNPKVITLIGGVVQSLYEEWQMNQRYSGFSHSSMRLLKETNSGGPPPFEKLQIAAPFRRSSQQGKPAVAQYGPVRYQDTATTHFQNMSRPNHNPGGRKYGGKDKQEEPQVFTIDKRIGYFQSTSKSSVLACVETSGNTQISQIGKQQNIDDLADEITTATVQNIEQRPSNSETRPKEGYFQSNSKSSVLACVETSGNTQIRQISKQQNIDDLADEITTAAVQNIEERPSNSETRPKEVAESVPVQNQAAAQKLLQKMSTPSQGDHYRRGRKHKGKGKQEELPVFTLDEYEKKKAGAKPPLKTDLPDTSCDEDLALQLQNQIDMEDSHVQMERHNNVADDIRMNMFNYEKDADRVHGMEPGGRGRGRGRQRSRGRGRGWGRGGSC